MLNRSKEHLINREFIGLPSEHIDHTVGVPSSFEAGVEIATRAINNAHSNTARKQEITDSFSHSGQSSKQLRQWPALGTLTKTEIVEWFHYIVKRTATAQETLVGVFTHFEAVNQFFADPSHCAPSSAEGIRRMLGAYRAASHAGQDLFQPQSEYFACINTLRLFTADLVDILPAESAAKGKGTSLFNDLVKEGTACKDWVNDTMVVLRTGDEGHPREKIKVFLECIKTRLEMLRKEEIALYTLAKDCVQSILDA